MISILAAASLGLPHASPIGRSIAAAPESISVDKGLQPIQAMPILVLPILLNTPGHLPQLAKYFIRTHGSTKNRVLLTTRNNPSFRSWLLHPKA